MVLDGCGPSAYRLQVVVGLNLLSVMASYPEQSWQGLRDEVCNTVSEWIRHSWASTVVNLEVRDQLRPPGGN